MVKTKQRKSKIEYGIFLPSYLLILFLSIVLLLTIIWQEVKVNTLKYNIGLLVRTKTKLQNEKKKLTLAKSELTKPERIISLASDKLGLVKKNNKKVTIIKVN